MHSPRLTSLVTLAAVLVAAQAAAEPPKGKPAEEAEQEPDAGTKRPAAPDTRTGNLYFGVHGMAVGPAGSMGPNTSSQSLAGAGFGAGGWLGFGVGRHGTFQLIGDYASFLAPGSCSPDCGGKSLTLGLGITYHLAQGIAFDPWASYGVAYRYSTFSVIDPASTNDRLTQRYYGIDIARLAIGGDWYPTPAFGFGPFLEVDLGTNFKRPPLIQPLPPDVRDGARAYAMFQIGFRLAFDPMRRAQRPAPNREAHDPRPSSF